MDISTYFDYSRVLVGKTIRSIDQVEGGSIVLHFEDGSVFKVLMGLYHSPEEALEDYRTIWTNYLKDNMQNPAIAQAASFWTIFKSGLEAPSASQTDDGFLMVWDKGIHHLQVEIYLSGGVYDWFHRVRGVEKLEGEEDIKWGQYSAQFESTLGFFTPEGYTREATHNA